MWLLSAIRFGLFKNEIYSISDLTIKNPILRTKSQGKALRQIEHIQYLMLKVALQARLQDPQCDAEALSYIYDLAVADGEGGTFSRAFRTMPENSLEMNA
jgi:hypothetical protein